MRRLSLSTKLFVAAVPLLVAVGTLLVLSIRDDLDAVGDARRGAQLGTTWEPLIASIRAIESEQRAADRGDEGAIVDARRDTDTALSGLRQVVRTIGDGDAMVVEIGAVTSAVGAGREAVDSGAEPQVAGNAYDTAARELIGLGRLLPAEVGDAELGRALLAVAALAAAEQTANDIVQAVGDWPASGDPSGVVEAALLGDSMIAAIDEFEKVAPEAWFAEFRDARWARLVADSVNELDSIVSAADRGAFIPFDGDQFEATTSGIVGVRDRLAEQIVADAQTKADALQRTTWIRIGITLAALVLAGLMAWLLARSITRRVRAVSEKAHDVASSQLPALVEAMRDPHGRGQLPAVAPIENAGSDELGELADAFNAVQATLVDVANEQVEVLRRGVSDIFVTMARRTRSLIDRQLALLDELESDVDDPGVLANYYRLDHLATRMRRNSESLLVLANAESRRRRTKATEIDDVVRAAIGEVEDYRRIDVLNLDPLQVRGAVVADISHLLAELLDNASAFSPPESRVTVAGRRTGDRYLLSIADEGVGIGPERLAELNDLLANPPIIGLSVEPTLGISVVSLLARKHGIRVQLLPAPSGLLVEVVLPATLYGPIDAGAGAGGEAVAAGGSPQRSEVEWTGAAGDLFVPQATDSGGPFAAPSVESTPVGHPDPVVAGAAAGGASEPVTSAAAPAPAASGSDAAPDWESSPEWSLTPAWATAAAAPPVLPGPSEPQLATSAAPDPPAEMDPDGVVAAWQPYQAPGAAEFDRMPAPPEFATPPASRPFTDPVARPLPARRPEHEDSSAPPPLPTRTRGHGPDGPDRLAPQFTRAAAPPSPPPAVATDPTTLRAALTAFEAGRAGTRPEPPHPLPLPTRAPGRGFDHDAVTPSTAQSHLDPDVIRERLRSFQQEFKLGRNGDTADDHDGDPDDLEGKP